MLKKILLGMAGLLVLLLAVVSLQPSTFHVERAITVAAPVEAAHAQVDDLRAWQGWSPWEKLDPGMKRTYDGAARGVGAKYAWVGKQEVGEGRMTIVKSEPSQIVIELEFLKPFAATHTATFTFSRTPEGTKTTWAMDGKNSFLSKALHLVMDMDKMLGSEFERGLAAMKTKAESSPKAPVAAAP